MRTLLSTSLRFAGASVVLLLLQACQSSPGIRMRYDVERALYDATHANELLLIKPELVTNSQIAEVRAKYETAYAMAVRALAELKNSDDSLSKKELSVLAFTAAFQIQESDYKRGAYTSARDILTDLLAKTELPRFQYIQARLSLGRATQSLGRWEDAVAIYDEITERFYPPLEPNGEVILPAVNLPYEIYVADHTAGDEAVARERGEKLVGYYRKLLEEFPSNAELTRQLHTNLCGYYRYEKDYDKALEHVAFLTGPSGQLTPEAQFEKWNIMAEGMGQRAEVLHEMETYQFSDRDTVYNGMLMFQLARNYASLRMFDSCRAKIYEIKSKYRRQFEESADPQSLLAQTFATEGNWDRAENELRFLIDTYPFSPQAFEAHLDVLDHYESVGDTRKLEEWRKKSMDFYEHAARQYAGTEMEANAYRYIAEVHRMAADWQGTADALAIVAQRFPEADIGRACAIAGSEVFRTKLGNQVMADSLMRIFRRSFPRDVGVPNPKAQ